MRSGAGVELMGLVDDETGKLAGVGAELPKGLKEGEGRGASPKLI
jgi:hypothetical protein